MASLFFLMLIVKAQHFLSNFCPLVMKRASLFSEAQLPGRWGNAFTLVSAFMVISMLIAYLGLITAEVAISCMTELKSLSCYMTYVPVC